MYSTVKVAQNELFLDKIFLVMHFFNEVNLQFYNKYKTSAYTVAYFKQKNIHLRRIVCVRFGILKRYGFFNRLLYFLL